MAISTHTWNWTRKLQTLNFHAICVYSVSWFWSHTPLNEINVGFYPNLLVLVLCRVYQLQGHLAECFSPRSKGGLRSLAMGRALKQLQHVLPSLRCPAVLGNFFELRKATFWPGLGVDSSNDELSELHLSWLVYIVRTSMSQENDLH